MKILNFGSLNIDYVYSLDHIVAEGETISSSKLEVFCGGKGLNQSVALARAGAFVFHAGMLGRDGELLKNYLEQSGVDTGFIEYADVPSGNAIIQLDRKGQNSIILFGGANREISEAYAQKVLKHFSKGDILLLQNEISSLNYVIEMASKIGMRIALNPSPMNDAILTLPLKEIEWFILNEIEGKVITGKTSTNEIADSLLERYPQSKVVLTLGKEGVIYKDSFHELKHGIYDVPVIDTTAAGDTFTGYFLASVYQGWDVKTALEKASIASSLAVSKKGAANSIPSMHEVDEVSLRLC